LPQIGTKRERLDSAGSFSTKLSALSPSFELGYVVPFNAKAGQTVRAEPFDAVELRVDELFGADPEDD
jgi:hypothetical protein